MNPEKKQLFLVRHGTTADNEADILQGRVDNPLSETGLREARQVAEYMHGESIQAVFSSPMLRARQTAEAIATALQLPIQIIDNFCEIDLGEWEGQKYEMVQKKYADFHLRWVADSSLPVPGGESFDQVFTRVAVGLPLLWKEQATSMVLVGHATVNRAVLGNLIGMPATAARLFRTQNASISKLVLFDLPDRRYSVVDYWNCTAHLQGAP